MIKNKKNAFTLSELMVIMFIISVVATVTLVIQKPFDKGMGMLYQSAYRTLDAAIYNIKLNASSTTDILDNAEPYYNLCNNLKSYINVTEEYSCNENYVNLDGTVSDSAVQFATTNGMKFYFSDGQNLQFTFNSNTVNIPYRLIVVDLNGNSKPNTAVWSKKKMADIVGFVVTGDGDVLPVGYPTIDTRYFTAKMAYPDPASPGEFLLMAPTTYYEAKNRAWGLSVHIDEPQSYNFNNDLSGNLKVSAFPFTTPFNSSNPQGCKEHTGTEKSPCEVWIEEFLN